MKHAEFHRGYIWVALATGLGAGFAIGGHLTFILGFGFPPGRGFASFIQAHGHVQLVGWAGLFIMGISLHFLPRFAGLPLTQPQCPTWVLWCMASGLGLRTVGQTVLPYCTHNRLFEPVLWLTAGSGGLEWCGILLYVALLMSTMRGMKASHTRPALLAVKPYLRTMMLGWVLYACLNLGLLLDMALNKQFVVHAAWNQFAIDAFLGLVLLPVAFAFSVRLFPLYLRLAAPTWPVQKTAYVYLVGWGLQALPTIPPVLRWAPEAGLVLSHIGMLLKCGVILWFSWRLDILTRYRAARIPRHKKRSGSERRDAGPELLDNGVFGRFDRLVVAAYIWLVLAACCEGVAAAAALAGYRDVISHDTIRHMYALGFVTLLIFGVAVRLIPGFLHQRQVASTILVEATFWLGNAAVISRILLLVLPAVVLQAAPGSFTIARAAFALSGILGLAAVLCLTINLWRTAHHAHGKRQPACSM